MSELISKKLADYSWSLVQQVNLLWELAEEVPISRQLVLMIDLKSKQQQWMLFYARDYYPIPQYSSRIRHRLFRCLCRNRRIVWSCSEDDAALQWQQMVCQVCHLSVKIWILYIPSVLWHCWLYNAQNIVLQIFGFVISCNLTCVFF